MYNKTQNNFLPNIFKTDQQLLNHASVMAKCIFTFSLIHQEMDDSQFILYSDVLRLWNIITHWSNSHYVWKCSQNLRGCYESIYDLPFDPWCALALKYYHTLIYFPLRLEEVLTKFKGLLWVYIWSTFRWSMFRYWMCWDSDIYSCIDPSAATSSRSARDFLVPMSDVMIYVLIFNVLRLWYIFMLWSFSCYIWSACNFLVPTSDVMIYVFIFNVHRLWYIFNVMSLLQINTCTSFNSVSL